MRPLSYNHSFLPVRKGAALAKRVRSYVPFYGYILWFLLLLPVYYKQVWQLFVMQPRMWLEENYSLKAWVSVLHSIVTAGIFEWPLSSLGEVIHRAIYALIGAGIILFTAQILGAGVFSMIRWSPEHWIEKLLYQTALGLCLLSYLLLGIAGLGLYHRHVVLSLIVTVVALGTASFIRNGSLPPLRHSVAVLVTTFRGAFQTDRIWKLIGLLALLIAMIGALAPEKEYDAL